MSPIDVLRHRWTRADWAAVDADAFHNCELIEGEVVDMAAMGARHAVVTDHIRDVFAVALHGSEMCSGCQTPVIIDDYNEPEPDIWVARVRRSALRLGKPSADELLLLVEVSDSTWRSDRRVKIPTYAAAAIATVWIVDVGDDTIEVHSTPDPGARTYRSVVTLTRSDAIDTPWSTTIDVASLIPESRV